MRRMLVRAFAATARAARPETIPALTIKAWDMAASGIPLPPAPWGPDAHGPHGAIRGYNDHRFRTAWLDGAGMLVMYDRQRNLGLVAVRDARQWPWYERAAPLRTLLHWWAVARGCLLTHAAAVGTARAGCLVVGPGGSGKSTVALSALGSSLSYAGDDYVLVEFGSSGAQAGTSPSGRAVSLYATAKLAPDHLRRFGHFTGLVEGKDWSAGEKSVLFLREAMPQAMTPAIPIDAIILPRVVGSGPNRITPMARAAALRAVAPSTLFQVPDGDAQAFASLARLVARLPCHELALGADCMKIPEALHALLCELPAM